MYPTSLKRWDPWRGQGRVQIATASRPPCTAVCAAERCAAVALCCPFAPSDPHQLADASELAYRAHTHVTLVPRRSCPGVSSYPSVLARDCTQSRAAVCCMHTGVAWETTSLVGGDVFSSEAICPVGDHISPDQERVCTYSTVVRLCIMPLWASSFEGRGGHCRMTPYTAG